ncbi:MAG: MBL fold metallo-hydrolase [Candidatus Kapabacteria bacterium]|nr:MBL fold metallo-hydrolase [Candidatus Kapabacteria bacterium]
MRKKLKIALIGFGAIILILVLIGAYFFYQFNSETKVMHPAETGNIVDNIYSIKDAFVNMYLIKDGNQYIAIDAGKDIEVVSAELKKLNIDENNVVAVFLTHTDMDHVAALPLFRNAKIYFSRNEVLMLTGQKQKVPFMSNSISRKDYTLLDNNQTLNIGNTKIFCILTEGHTSGSMCYQVNSKYLFTGDILSLNAGKLGTSVKFFDLDHEMANKSISKITKLPDVEYIFSAHHGYTNDYKNAVKDWKE